MLIHCKFLKVKCTPYGNLPLLNKCFEICFARFTAGISGFLIIFLQNNQMNARFQEIEEKFMVST